MLTNRDQFIQQYTQINRKFEEKFMPPVQKAIHSKVEGTISKLRNEGYHAAVNYLHTDLGNPEMTIAIHFLYLIVGKKHAQLNYSRLLHETRRRKSVDIELQTKGFGFNSAWAEFILNYLKRFLTTKITFTISFTTRDALLKALSVMVLDGLSVDGMIEKLQDWPFERYQAARIVRTEVGRAASVGAAAQSFTSEYQQLKEWIAIIDNRTRGVNPNDHADHIDLDGVTIDENDQFTDPRNGDRLDFPKDPNAEAESTINCRCAVGYSLKRDQNGNPIRKRQSTTVIFPGQIFRPHTITI